MTEAISYTKNVFAMTKRGVITMTGENLWKVTGNYQIKSIIRDY